MIKRLFYFFVLILCPAVSGSSAFAGITVDDALATWEAGLESPAALLEVSGKVESHILVEYATVMYEEGLARPADLLEASGKAGPRIVVEYATSVYHGSLREPDVLTDISEKVSPRIVVASAPIVFKTGLIYPFEPIPGDFSRNGELDLGDVIRILKTLCGDTFHTAYKDAEPSGNGKVGGEDAILILREIADK